MKGERYLDSNNQWLANSIPTLHCADFATAKGIYKKILGFKGLRDKDIALLGCNDRFFLLMHMFGRLDVMHPWLYYRCREVEIAPDGYLDLWARDHYKSTIITYAGTIQEILINPDITIGIFSHTKTIAEGFMKQIMLELERNEELKRVYADVLWEEPRKQAPRWSFATGIVVQRKSNPKEGTVEAWGLVDGQPTSKHFALLIYDDVVTRESVTTPEMIKKTTEAWELSDNLGTGKSRKWHVGTRYSFADSYGIMLERRILTPRLHPATDNGRLDGKPVFISNERWEEKKNTQRSTVAAQMLQNPIAGNENMFKPEWFRTYEIRPSILNVYIMGDPSKGSSATSDRTAIAVVGIDQHANKYLLDGVRHRMSMSERWRILKQLHMKWSAEPGVEHVKVGWERYGQQTDDEYFKERMREENYPFELLELAWPRQGGHSKKDRVERLEPDVRNGRFFFSAVMWKPGLGDCLWSISEQTSQPVETPMKGLPRNMQAMKDSGREHLVARSIRRMDEDRKPYDLTQCLVEEMLFFPFAPKDDLVDAVSRIYDMEPMTPSVRENEEADLLNANDFEDA